MSEQMTILKGLKNKKSLINTIKEAQGRATKYAVGDKDKVLDYDVNVVLSEYLNSQMDLRKLKVAIAKQSLNNTVSIPKADFLANLDLEEESEMSLIEAVLLRDDLKGYCQLLRQVTAQDGRTAWDYDYSGGSDQRIKVETVRKYDFAKLNEEIDEVQEFIDEIDVRIQYADASTKIDI